MNTHGKIMMIGIAAIVFSLAGLAIINNIENKNKNVINEFLLSDGTKCVKIGEGISCNWNK